MAESWYKNAVLNPWSERISPKNVFTFHFAIIAILVVASLPTLLLAQQGAVVVQEFDLLLPTYAYSKPNPVPCPESDTVDRQLWPYFAFDGYTTEQATQSWRCVRLDNGLVSVDVLPQIGGKVWGALDKVTGREFLYRNNVIKFRNIATRGPWTSGGIEFNFGMLGHSPATASPVDYLVRTNCDGSASCFVGVLEFITRTRWCVEIRVTPGERSFTTHSVWHNSSGLDQPCYQWMNAAYPTGGQYIFGGSHALEHDGRAQPWPVDKYGRNLSHYANNNFGKSKSYHIVGGNTGSFCVWWEDIGFGSLHEAESYDRLGRKIWIWNLARNGAIWEDLLTDKDGHYVELQGGRYFNQPATKSYRTPFKLPAFTAGDTITFCERWSPVSDPKTVDNFKEQHSATVERPLEMPADFDWNSIYGQTLFAEQMVNVKRYHEAEPALRQVLVQEPHSLPALVCLADLLIHCGRLSEALEYSEQALSIDAYQAKANYISGLIFAAQGKTANSRERFSVVSLAPERRSAALVGIANLDCSIGAFDKALQCATLALEVNPLNMSALHLKAMALRHLGLEKEHRALCLEGLERFPLFHALRYELSGAEFVQSIRCEQPHEEIMEAAFSYARAGFYCEAARIVELARESWLAAVTHAYMLARAGNDREGMVALSEADKLEVEFVTPFRQEMLPVLRWAETHSETWKVRYSLALLLRYFGDRAGALTLMDSCDSSEVPFLLFRAKLREGAGQLADIRRAQKSGKYLDYALKAEWQHYAQGNAWQAALPVAEKLRECYPDDSDSEIMQAQTLLRLGQYDQSLAVLAKLNFLPSEFSRLTREIYREACLSQAIIAFKQKKQETMLDAIRRSAIWDERLGVGQPYTSEIDQRLEHWLQAEIASGSKRRDLLQKVATGFQPEAPDRRGTDLVLLRILAERELGTGTAMREKLAILKDDNMQEWCCAILDGNKSKAAQLYNAVSGNSNIRLLSLLFN
jgi:tetratricopeptide (TPR) repeat protein